MAQQSFLGVGWRFPVEVERSVSQPVRIAVSEYEQLIEESIRIILTTSKGERVMRPDFGSDLKRLVYSPNNTATAGLAIFYVQQALKKWEPRIVLLEVDANADPDNEASLLISIHYRIVATNNERNLVYPFFLEAE